MAWAYSKNHTFGSGTTGASWVWTMVSLLVANGWTKVRDSDGTTYSSTGAQVTTESSGAHGLGNANAWVELRNPDGTLYVTIQRGANNLVWRVKFAQAAFTGGTPGATQTGSATNEAVQLGGGTDAAPTFGQLVGQNDGGTPGYVGQFCAETTAPYRVVCWAYDATGAVAQSIHTQFIVNTITAFLTSGDTFPFVFHISGGSSGTDQMNYTVLSNPSGSQGVPCTWLGNPGVGTFGPVPCPTREMSQPGAVQITPDLSPTNPITSTLDLFPLEYIRYSSLSAPTGYKGSQGLFFWRPRATHKTGDLYNVAGTGDAVCLANLVFTGWDGTALTAVSGGTNQGSARLLVPSSPDSTAPVVSNVTPTAGTTITPTTQLGCDVTDNAGALKRVVVIAQYATTWEVVHDGDAFGPQYSTGSTRVAITNGYRFALTRAGGWPAAPTLKTIAYDTAGNEN